MRLVNGKVFKKYRPAGAKPSGTGKNEAVVKGLETICTPVYATYCVYEGDPEVETCGEEEYVGDNCETVWVEDPVHEPELPPAGPDDPCTDPANGCYPGDGGGGYPQPEPTRDIENNLPDGCIKNVVNELIQQDIKYNINESMQSIFNRNDNINLIFNQAALSNDTDGTTGVANFVLKPDGWKHLTADITLNGNTLPNASKEYIAATILHEALHAYMIYTYQQDINAIFDHHVMAEDYIKWFENSMLTMFPNINLWKTTHLPGWVA